MSKLFPPNLDIEDVPDIFNVVISYVEFYEVHVSL